MTMTNVWTRKSQDEIKQAVFAAIEKNINYDKQGALGVPASYLDDKVFNQDASFLKEAPFMYALVKNPNHIGCHTLGKSEPFFEGTHAIEKELIEICAVDILKGAFEEQDGYVASGGTEANIQAIWIYRNYFVAEHSAKPNEIAIVCSEDSHYSMDKAANLLSIDIYKVAVDKNTREISKETVEQALEKAKNEGKKHFVVICNMMTTMFGSVDNIEIYTDCLASISCEFKIHVDGAYGGFYYPFTHEESLLTFQNKAITSFTLDAHKMAQSPYGTGIFLIRKGFIQYVNTQEASYVEGEDFTLIGSRSGANAIAVWMILVKNGPYGWYEKIYILQKRSEWLCNQLEQLGVKYYRNPMSNIITIGKQFITHDIAVKFGLVPDNHTKPEWFKVVIMDHVSIEKLALLIEEIKKAMHSS
ncbi:MAG: pyridoxal phosphate-dependent decarboxylase family protein [Calditrichia bacterium]